MNPDISDQEWDSSREGPLYYTYLHCIYLESVSNSQSDEKQSITSAPVVLCVEMHASSISLKTKERMGHTDSSETHNSHL